MKSAGLLLLIVGLLMTLYTGFTFITKENVVEVGELVITKDNEHSVNWKPYVGFGVMAVGGAFFLFGRKKT